MKILAIETSTARGSIAFWEGGETVVEEVFRAPRGHNTAVFGPLGKVLERSGSEFDFIAVGTGPGSYGGVRVGIAVANALGLVFESAVIGVPSLLAPMGLLAGNYTVVGDARRDSFFVSRVRGARIDGEIALWEAGPFAEEVAALAGAGEPVITFDDRPPAASVSVDAPGAGRLASALAGMSEDEVSSLGGRPPEPIYLRAPYITTPKAG